VQLELHARPLLTSEIILEGIVEPARV
jgi:hypothetical protein